MEVTLLHETGDYWECFASDSLYEKGLLVLQVGAESRETSHFLNGQSRPHLEGQIYATVVVSLNLLSLKRRWIAT